MCRKRTSILTEERFLLSYLRRCLIHGSETWWWPTKVEHEVTLDRPEVSVTVAVKNDVKSFGLCRDNAQARNKWRTRVRVWQLANNAEEEGK